MYIVTGGAGFIGSNLIKYLNSKGISDILVIDDLTDGRKLKTLCELNFKNFLDADGIAAIQHLPEGSVKKVFHLGAISSTTETDGKKLMQYNYTHTLTWLAFCKSQNIKLVYTSSASVYGNSTTFKESEQMSPLNPYAISKALSEKAMDGNPYANTWVFRPFNVYGPGESHKDNQMSPISKFQQQFEETGKVQVFEGSENIKRDFISVQDVVKVLVDHTDVNPGTYNLGTGQAKSFLDIAKLVTDNIETIPFPNHLLGNYQYYSCANLDKLRADIIGRDFRFTTVDQYYDNLKRTN